MRLKSISYTEFEDKDRQWKLEGLTVGPINLIVGKNASGKSRALTIINALGRLVSGRMKPSELTTGRFEATFAHESWLLHYALNIEENKVIAEEFRRNEEKLLERKPGGKGEIWYVKENQKQEFQTPDTEAAVVGRRGDTIQHDFLLPLGEWGERLRYYEFGKEMGHGRVAVLVKDGPEPDPADVNAAIPLFLKGQKEFPGQFAESVKNDMNEIGYDLESVGVMPPTDIKIRAPIGAAMEAAVLYVKERGLPCNTQQMHMSQGMFRALSVIVHLNYASIASLPSAILIDDIGEGLDFERSCKLIGLLRDRARKSNIQLILSTNDRFVMNEVPLEEWSILQRTAGHVRVLNVENSRKLFEDFKFTGLSNFSFFEMDFANGPPAEEAQGHD